MDNNSGRIKREKYRTALVNTILIAAAAAVFVLVLIGLYKIGVIQLPDVIENLFGSAETETPSGSNGGDDMRIYASLSGTPAASDDYALEYDIDPASLLAMLRSASQDKTFYAESLLTRSDGNKTQTDTIKLSRSGDKYRAEIYDGSTLAVSIICDGVTVRYTDYTSYGKKLSRDYPVSGDFSLEEQLGLPSLDKILGDDGISDLHVTLLRTEDENLYCVQYTYPNLSQQETVYVSLKYGYVVSAETYLANTIVYKLKTTKFDTDTTFGNDIFNIDK